jgi:hypothetical protein
LQISTVATTGKAGFFKSATTIHNNYTSFQKSLPFIEFNFTWPNNLKIVKYLFCHPLISAAWGGCMTHPP